MRFKSVLIAILLGMLSVLLVAPGSATAAPAADGGRPIPAAADGGKPMPASVHGLGGRPMPAAVLDDGLGGKPTPATRRLTCNASIPYLRIYNNTGTLCFADAGTLGVNILGVTGLSAGNNSGYVIWGRSGEPNRQRFFTKGSPRSSFSPPVYIVTIHIN